LKDLNINLHNFSRFAGIAVWR